MNTRIDKARFEDHGPASTELVERRAWPRRVAPLFLVAGAVLAGNTLLGHAPREREIELHLEDPTTILRIDVSWLDAPVSGSEAGSNPLHGSSWRFGEGNAPRSVRSIVRLPDGTYDLEITVDRTIGRETTRRAITLGDADRITVPVH